MLLANVGERLDLPFDYSFPSLSKETTTFLGVANDFTYSPNIYIPAYMRNFLTLCEMPFCKLFLFVTHKFLNSIVTNQQFFHVTLSHRETRMTIPLCLEQFNINLHPFPINTSNHHALLFWTSIIYIILSSSAIMQGMQLPLFCLLMQCTGTRPHINKVRMHNRIYCTGFLNLNEIPFTVMLVVTIRKRLSN